MHKYHSIHQSSISPSLWGGFGMAIFSLLLCLQSFAQAYHNQVFRPEIKSVELYNTSQVASFPIIDLAKHEQVLLSFDDLHGGSRNYYYTIEHCDADWNSSNLSPAEYLQSFNEARILDYRYSTGTIQRYTHYEVKLPNENITPKISGNYILKVYEDGDQGKLLLTKRFYVLGSRVSLSAEVVPSNNPSLRQSNQKINFQVDYGSLRVQNPSGDLKTIIMQNRRSQTSVLNSQPANIRGTQLIYNDIYTNDFPGRNEFRHFDIRSLKLNSDRISHIYRDTALTVMLLGDPLRNKPNYTFEYDNDGEFFINNTDYSQDARIDADYAHVYFSLAANRTPQEGSAYLIGEFNNYQLDEHSKLDYDATKGRFFTNLLLKQGVYDYEYVWVDKASKQANDTTIEGSYFETENDYQLLVYYRPPGARWDELVGFRQLNTANKR